MAGKTGRVGGHLRLEGAELCGQEAVLQLRGPLLGHLLLWKRHGRRGRGGEPEGALGIILKTKLRCLDPVGDRVRGKRLG